MRCENGTRGFVAAMRSSIERRRVCNAKVTSQRQRKYQELTLQREQENLQRAKAILERRKSERDRLNAYMHSVGNPHHAKHPDYFKRMRRLNTEGTIERPPWTDSLRNDYDTLIKLREKEIAVTTLRLENQKELPTKGENLTNETDESYLLEKGNEFRHDYLQPIQKSNGSYVQDDLKVLKNELVAFTNEARRYQTDIGKNLLLMEPTVFREHPLTGVRAVPPTVPTSSLKVFTPPLKSCLKTNKNNQKYLETPRLCPQVPSERYMSQPAVTTSKMVSSEPQTRVMTTTTIKTVKNLTLSPDMFSWSDHEDMDHFKEYPNPVDTSITEEIFVMSTEEKVTAENSLPDPRPISESESTMSCSSADPPVDASETAQRTAPTPSTLPPRYTSTCESWQESKEFESLILDEHPSPSPPRENEEKTWKSDEEIFITSLNSEAATTRLIAEVIAVQSRLEDCKLKPLDFRNMFTEPPPPDRGRTLEKESKPATDGYEIFHNHKGQGTIQVAMRHHEIFSPDDTRRPNLEQNYREKESTPESAPKATVDDNETDRVTTSKVDNFTEMDGFEEVESRQILHGAADDGKNEAEERRGAAEERREVAEERRGVAEERRGTAELTADPGMDHEKLVVASNIPPTPPKPVRSTVPKQPRGVKNQHPFVKQTDDDARCPVMPESRAESTEDRSDCSLLSTKRTSKYLNNIGYRDLSEAPRPKYTKQHCFYSSNGLLQVGYSQPRQPPKPVKQNKPQHNNHDSLGDKENYGMSGSNDQEQSILASLERLDWKLAAMSARVKNRASITPSMASQNQNSIQSAPAATGNKGPSGDGTPMKLSIHPLRPSSVRSQKPPARNFRRRRQIVGVTNKFHQEDYD